MKKTEKMVIDGEEWIKASAVKTPTGVKDEAGHQCYMVRTYSAGVFMGYLVSESADGKKVTLAHARRIWYWEGAASLSQLATEGTKKPGACKFPCAVAEVVLTECVERIAMTPEAVESINAVAVWTAKE